MHKTKIYIAAFVLIACNAVAAALLFALPAKDVSSIPAEQRTEPVAAIVAPAPSAPENVSQIVPTVTPRALPPVAEVHQEAVPAIPPEPVLDEATDPQKDPIRIPVHEAGTVLDAMHAYETVSDTFSYAGKDHLGIGFYVTEINGKREGDGYYWILYVNGKTADLGASRQQVTPSDVVEWRFEEGY